MKLPAARMVRILLVTLLYSTWSTGTTAYADWAYAFVVYNNSTYVVSDKFVEAEQLEYPIGRVTSYSDREGTYSGNFSNSYPKGTTYYKLRYKAPHEAIAVAEGNTQYRLAEYKGPYHGSKWSRQWILSSGLIVASNFLLLGYILYRRRKRKADAR